MQRFISVLSCVFCFGLGSLYVGGWTNSLEAAVIRVPQDQPTIQKGIAVAKPGDVVEVSAGTYREVIRLKPHITVRSAGDQAKGKLGLKRAEATILDGTPGQGKTAGVTMAEGATLDGLTVTQVGTFDEKKWKHHYDTQGNEQPHEHIGEFHAPGIGIEGVNCTVIHNIVHHNGNTGIAIRGVKNRGVKNRDCSPLIKANVCYRNMGGGIGSMGDSTATIDGNTCFQNFYAGIGHEHAHPIVINNVCYDNVRAGIGVSEGGRPIVRHNRCFNNRRAGIGVRTGKDTSPVIEHNECYENAMAGIGCEENATPIIRNNRCYKNRLAGIGSQEGAQPIIVENECFENQAAGIGCREHAKPLIVRNICRKNLTAGIGVRAHSEAVVCFNRCEDNKLVAVGLPDGASALLYKNQLSRTGGMPPLVAVKGQSSATLVGNTLQGGGVAGVLVEGNVRLLENQFLAKDPRQGTAIWIWANSQAQVGHNRFQGYRQAVRATGSEVVVQHNEIAEFQGTAIVVAKPKQPAVVIGNRAKSNQEKNRIVEVEGKQDYVGDNTLDLISDQ